MQNTSKKSICFHCLPLKNLALLKLRIVKLKNSPVNAYAKVSSAHFHPDCYLRDLINELTNVKSKFTLKIDAIPAIFDLCHCAVIRVLPHFLTQCFVGQSVFKKLVFLYYICRNCRNFRNFRYAAYRSLIHLIYGKFGKERR